MIFVPDAAGLDIVRRVAAQGQRLDIVRPQAERVLVGVGIPVMDLVGRHSAFGEFAMDVTAGLYGRVLGPALGVTLHDNAGLAIDGLGEAIAARLP